MISSGLPTRGGRARIVVTRGGGRGRRLVNEGRHPRFPGCARLRCVTMDGLSVPEQAALFERAEIVVAPHCAAVTNLIPAREGAVVVGLFPPRHIEPSHFATASHRKLRYDYVVGEEARGTPRDFAVDVDKLAHLMATYGLA